MKPTAALLIAAALAVPTFASLAQEGKAPVAAPAKPDAAQGSAKFGSVCAACHGADGNSSVPTYPKLAQQFPEYLVKQLHDFKDGKRANPIMQGFASQLSDADMSNVAAWVSTQKAKPGFAKDKDLVMTGERIFRGGVAERQIPACAGCHSPDGAGVPIQYPRLSGQQPDYVAAQLTAFRDGVRKNNPIMAQVAARLNDREIKALADYIAGLR